jgi:ribosome maturation factor RimP
VGQKPAFFVIQDAPFCASVKDQDCAAMTTMKPIENKIADLIADDLSTAGYELVRVMLTPGGRYMTLQVMAERTDRKPMTVEDCVGVSHAVSAILEKTSPVESGYTLEVSSPGIDRPLVRRKDFERFTGHVARIDLAAPLNGQSGGQKRFEGRIHRVTGPASDAEIELKTESGDVRLALNGISRARLVLTEELLNTKSGNKH